jgi:hypothetical protein
LDPELQRKTITVAPQGMPKSEIPIPALMIDLGKSTVEATFEDGHLYAFIRREGYPEYVLCGNHIKYWIHEWQKINTTWTDENGAMLDVPTDVVDKSGNVMEPRMDSAERFFLRQQGAFLLYMHGPLQFEAWNSRTGGKWFLHFCTFDSYDPVPKLTIFSDCRDASDTTPPKIINLTGATITEHLDDRQRSKMKIEISGKPSLICDGPNIQWWLGALQWATRDKTAGKAMFRDLIKHRRFVPVEKSISVLRLQRRSSVASVTRKRSTIEPSPSALDFAKTELSRPKPGDVNDVEMADLEKKKGDWKSKSGSHATQALTNAQRLSAAEFARQAGQSPPRRRRSSAPKPDKRSTIEQDPTKKPPLPSQGSRANIPLVSISIKDDIDGVLAEPSPQANQTSPRQQRKSPRAKARSSSATRDSPLADAKSPQEEAEEAQSLPRKAKSPLDDDVPVSPRRSKSSLAVPSSTIEKGPKSPRRTAGPLKDAAEDPKDEAIQSPAKSPLIRSPLSPDLLEDEDEDDVPDLEPARPRRKSERPKRLKADEDIPE